MHEAHESSRRSAPESRPYGAERGSAHAQTRQALDDALTGWAETLAALCRSLVGKLHERSTGPDISIFEVSTKPRFWKDAETETARRLLGHGWVLQAYTGPATTSLVDRTPTHRAIDPLTATRRGSSSGWCLLESASILEYTGTAPTGERRNGEGRRIDFTTDKVHFPPASVPSSGQYRGAATDYRADLLRDLGVPGPYTREHLGAVAPIHRDTVVALEGWNNLLGAYARRLESEPDRPRARHRPTPVDEPGQNGT